MPCYCPRPAWLVPGKGLVFRNPRSDKDGITCIDFGCGQCTGCRRTKMLDWGVRGALETRFHESLGRDCWFFTLTHRVEERPAFGSLSKRDIQLFIMRLRERYYRGGKVERGSADGIRYMCGAEYGHVRDESGLIIPDLLGAPHYHLIVWNLEIPDLYADARSGKHLLYRSPTIEKLWPKGFVTIGRASAAAAAYTMKYVMKRIGGDAAFDRYSAFDPDTGEIAMREREFCLTSKNPGVGKPWLDKYGVRELSGDFVLVDGKKCPIPRYFLGFLKESFVTPGADSSTLVEPDPADWIKEFWNPVSNTVIDDKFLLAQRQRQRMLSPSVVENNTPERLLIREESQFVRQLRYDSSKVVRGGAE